MRVFAQPEPAARYYSLTEAAELGYGAYSTLRNYIAAGRLKAAKVGSAYKVTREDLEAMLEPVERGRPSEVNAIDRAIDQLVKTAPRLTTEQRERLAVIIGGGHR